MQQHPRVTIELRVSSSMDVMERVQRMSLDLGFVAAPVNSTYLQATPWVRDSLVVCCAPDNPLASRPRIMLNELRNQPWVLEKTASSERTAFTTEALKYINSINVVLETDSIEAVKRVVRQSQIIACTSALAVEDEVRRGELAILKMPELTFTRICSLITRRNVYYSQALEAFRTFAMQQCASALADPVDHSTSTDNLEGDTASGHDNASGDCA